jgi:hypothetical protein
MSQTRLEGLLAGDLLNTMFTETYSQSAMSGNTRNPTSPANSQTRRAPTSLAMCETFSPDLPPALLLGPRNITRYLRYPHASTRVHQHKTEPRSLELCIDVTPTAVAPQGNSSFPGGTALSTRPCSTALARVCAAA